MAATAIKLREATTSNVAFGAASATDSLDVVKNVVLLRAGPGNLADRHWYTESALRDAADRGIFEGVQAYLDHPSVWDENNQPGRSVRDLAGWYSNVTVKPYTDPKLGQTVALFADFHPAIGKPEVNSIVRTCLEYATRFPRMAWAGLSINAAGASETAEMDDGEQWNRVDRIDEADSVDIVTRAGAGGTLVALKESYRMKTATEDVKLTFDAEAAKSGVKKILEGAKKSLKETLSKAKIEEGKIKLSPDQDDELDKSLGLVDGGALDKVFDDATGVEDEPDDDEPDKKKERREAAGDEDDVDGMPDDPKFLKAQLRKERKSRKTAESEATQAARRATEAEKASQQITRERMAENVMAELNIPDWFRPRLRHELVTGGFAHERAMREHAQGFDKAFIRPQLDGAGVVGGLREKAAVGGNFDFSGGN